MFDLFFKYPREIFAKGQFVLLAPWPSWVLAIASLLAVAGVAWFLWRRPGKRISGFRPAAVWALQSATLVLLLLLLWQPALSVSTLKPQQNIISVIVDDSRSMSLKEDGGKTRIEQARDLVNSSSFKELGKKFQVRYYRLGAGLDRLDKPETFTGAIPATHVGSAVKQAMAESSGLPVGAVLLLSDGADNTGGIDIDTLAEIRRYRIPIHTVGFGRERMSRDVELMEVEAPTRALADARLSAAVTFRQSGFDNRKARIVIRDGSKQLAVQEVTLKGGGSPQSEQVLFNAGPAGAHNLQIAIEGVDGEENPSNNSLPRLVNVASRKPRILYYEGEPRWEFKFIRRALEEDKTLELVTILRTTQNKIYRQGIANPNELAGGFPSKVEDLFAFDGVVIGSVEASSFPGAQQELIRNFVDRRGGGLLFLGGRAALADGGWAASGLAEVLPVTLPTRRGTFLRDPATVALTAAGRSSLITRVDENAARNDERWKKMPALADYQDIGTPKPGALVLAEATANKKLPLLVTQNYGRGRAGVFATGGSWRWQMLQPLEDQSHEAFWQQLARWLVSDTQGRVISSTPRQIVTDETRVPLRAEVRDTTYLPSSEARVEARVMGPDGTSSTVELKPDPLQQGVYTADWNAEKPGSYLAEVTATGANGQENGRDLVMFRREDGVAENFRAEQNRELLEKLSEQTGGRYFKRAEAERIAEQITYSEAGITVRETRDLWNMPVVFVGLFLLRGSEWLLRRKWGVV